MPPEPDEMSLLPELRRAIARSGRQLVVIDDDPTGVQTVYDAPVLLKWQDRDLRDALAGPAPLFFLLTNSRSVPEPEAERRNRAIGQALGRIAGDRVVIASRSDSTLRGHYPAEVLALETSLGGAFDGHLLVPAFVEGGRFTIGNTHWVATPYAASAEVVPASATPFARDAVFGYRTAYLPEWVAEKSHGRWRTGEVQSVPLEVVRGGRTALVERLMQIEGSVPVIVNAVGYGDLAHFTLGLLEAEARGKRFLYRTAASFVRTRAGLAPAPLLTPAQIEEAFRRDDRGQQGRGGLVVVGSHVPSSSLQLEKVLGADDLPVSGIEVSVDEVVGGVFNHKRAARRVDMGLMESRLVVLYTSRAIVPGTGADASLAIGHTVMDGLVETVARVRTRPRFVIGKGGITSHMLALRGLGGYRATALGQLLPGVPAWRLESGPRLRFPGMPYVVFPGNVGGPDDLAEAARWMLLTELP